ncbi:MAG: hypothetical protein U0Z17_05825 [Bacteroidales bacterium]
MRSEHFYKELDIPSFEGRPWDEELYITRIATLSMMEDAVEAKYPLKTPTKKLLEEIAATHPDPKNNTGTLCHIQCSPNSKRCK